MQGSAGGTDTPAATVKVTLKSEPSATIFVNGKALGATPKEVEVPRGTFELVLRQQGFKTYRAPRFTADLASDVLKLQPEKRTTTNKPKPAGTSTGSATRKDDTGLEAPD